MSYSSYGSSFFSGPTVWILVIAALALYLIAGARILKKGNEAAWKILIPIYGTYCLYKVANSEWIFKGYITLALITRVITFIISSSQRRSYYSFEQPNQTPVIIIVIISGIIALFLTWGFASNMAAAFGKGTGFAIGLFFLSPIFFLILAFGSAEYQYGYSKSALDSMAAASGSWKCRSCGWDNPVSRGTCEHCGAIK